MRKHDVVVRRGMVKAFNPDVAAGTLWIDDKEMPFFSTTFHSGLPTRFPASGEEVEVLFDGEGRIVIVRAARQSALPRAVGTQQLKPKRR